MKHKWHDVICAWARGERIQFRSVNDCGTWVDWRNTDNDQPAFYLPDYEWRIAPKMRRVTLESGEVVEWPEPMREAPEQGSQYWFPMGRGCCNYTWNDDWIDRGNFDSGRCHATQEAAEQHAHALRKINGAVG